MTGYNIDSIQPGAGEGGGFPGTFENDAASPGVLTGDVVYGWSLQNISAGLSTVYIRFGTEAIGTPYIAINLAENETVTQVFPAGIPSENGFHLTVEAGSVDGLIYTG